MNRAMEPIRRLAADIRIETIRQLACFGAGHIGGSMSIADALAVLYGSALRYRADQPDWPDRDYVVMSKGHCGPALYSALALSKFFPMEWLKTLNLGGTRLPSHCDRNKTPGIDASTGSLGQGISIACGFALGNRLRKMDNWVYAIVGDGELQEGQVWEAIQFAAHQQLGRLIILVDDNKKQLDGKVEDICDPMDLESKFSSFGCDTRRIGGNDVQQIAAALEEIHRTSGATGKPHVVLLDTRKGVGCLFAERKEANHHLPVSQEDADEAICEIERRLAAGLHPGGEQYDM
jgi:transketolase